MNKQKVYLETSFISYLAFKPSRDLVIAAHQQVTQDWWESRQKHFELYISQLVYEEAGKGNPEIAKKRLDIITEIPILELNKDINNLAKNIVQSKILPSKYIEDAIHIAIATIHGMDYLLTWNCKHIANASIRNLIENICRKNEYQSPIICTPEELMGG